MTVAQSRLANRPICEFIIVRSPKFPCLFYISEAYTSPKTWGSPPSHCISLRKTAKTDKFKGVVHLLVGTWIVACCSRTSVHFSSLCSQLMIWQTLSTSNKDLTDCFQEIKHKHEVNDSEDTVILRLNSILRVFSNLNDSILMLCVWGTKLEGSSGSLTPALCNHRKIQSRGQEHISPVNIKDTF